MCDRSFTYLYLSLLLHACLHLLHHLLHVRLDLLLHFAHDFFELRCLIQTVRADRNDDIVVLDAALLVVGVERLDLCDLFDCWDPILWQFTHLRGDQRFGGLLDFAQLQVPDVPQSIGLVERLVTRLHHGQEFG